MNKRDNEPTSYNINNGGCSTFEHTTITYNKNHKQKRDLNKDDKAGKRQHDMREMHIITSRIIFDVYDSMCLFWSLDE